MVEWIKTNYKRVLIYATVGLGIFIAGSFAFNNATETSVTLNRSLNDTLAQHGNLTLEQSKAIQSATLSDELLDFVMKIVKWFIILIIADLSVYLYTRFDFIDVLKGRLPAEMKPTIGLLCVVLICVTLVMTYKPGL